MRDMRSARLLYLFSECEKSGFPACPGGRQALLGWLERRLDEEPMDYWDPKTGDEAMIKILNEYPVQLESVLGGRA